MLGHTEFSKPRWTVRGSILTTLQLAKASSDKLSVAS